MKERDEHILAEVVKSYLDTGQPVGSRAIAEQRGMSLSPASIRSVMSELEHRGLLYSPHTSAGRVPTDDGLRYFVDTLMVVDPNLRQRLDESVASHLQSTPDINTMLHQATDELASLTHFAGLVSVRESGLANIRKLELVPLSSGQILAVIVSEGGEVQNRLIARPTQMSDSHLAAASVRLNELLHDCDLPEARQRLAAEMETDRLRIRQLLEELKSWADAPATTQADLFISGQSQLLEMPEFSVIDTVRSLVTAFEEKGHLLRLVEQVELEEQGVRVFIGREHALVNMEQVSVVLSRYDGPNNVVGTLGVIGPRRMHYERVMPIVDCTARWVSRMLGGRH
ncbi:MAG: heat-inducible transcriptional repressor HrcA [Mariprofundaceae bacterium]